MDASRLFIWCGLEVGVCGRIKVVMVAAAMNPEKLYPLLRSSFGTLPLTAPAQNEGKHPPAALPVQLPPALHGPCMFTRPLISISFCPNL